jgi:hypothetical protein
MKIEVLNDFLKDIGKPLGFDSMTAKNDRLQREFIANLDL